MSLRSYEDYARKVLIATACALVAAVLHATWNLYAKQSGDRFLALWAQFFVAGTLSGAILLAWTVRSGAPDIAWWWSAASGTGHLPYVIWLARAYERGDFSLAYPIMRGGGASSAAILGLLLLGDRLSALSLSGIGLVMVGMWLLTRGGIGRHLAAAALVAVNIGVYTAIDAHGARESQPIAYALSVFVTGTVTTTAWGLLTRRGELLPFLRRHARISAGVGPMSIVSYSLVLYAVTRAPVGYVATLRESSVLVAAFAGWRLLDEGDHRRRIAAAAVIVGGLALLVVGR